MRDGIGSVFWPRSAAATNALQRVAVEETRLGIPVLVGLDVIHGHRTIGPVPLAQAASFDPALVEDLARLAATEARSAGVTWTFSPMVDVSRDPRWGRVVEGFGEDVHLTAEMGRAMVRGYQGESLAASDAIAATAKHFVAYGQPEGGRDYNTVDASEHRLRNVHLEPFRAAVDEGAASVMAAFNTVGGRPMHANRRLLTDVLKSEWGFDGIVVGDADGVRNLIPHGVAGDLADAVRMAYAAGLDIEMGGAPSDLAPADLAAGPARPGADRRRRGSRARTEGVARALRRSLRARSRRAHRADRGRPTRGARRRRPIVGAAEERRHAAAREPRRVLVTGPYAESTDHLGAWTQSFAAPAGSIADELRARLPRAEVRVIPGVGFLDDDVSTRSRPSSRRRARATSCSSSRASRAPSRVRRRRAATCACPGGRRS